MKSSKYLLFWYLVASSDLFIIAFFRDGPHLMDDIWYCWVVRKHRRKISHQQQLLLRCSFSGLFHANHSSHPKHYTQNIFRSMLSLNFHQSDFTSNFHQYLLVDFTSSFVITYWSILLRISSVRTHLFYFEFHQDLLKGFT